MKSPLTLSAVVLLLCLGCGPGGAFKPGPVTREQKLAGLWTGKPVEEKSPKGETFLSEQLGGYSIKLQDDGRFLIDWRGLTKDGKWSVSGQTVTLKVEHVFGRTREQAKAESLADDLKLFDDSTELKLDEGDAHLTLPGTSPGSQTVVFSKSPK